MWFAHWFSRSATRGGAGASNRIGRPPRVLRGGDRRRKRGPLGGADRDQARADRALRPQPRQRGPGRALEVTGNAWEIKRLIEPHVAQVLVVSPNDTGIRRAGAKP